MANIIKEIKKILSSWYLRYQLSIELYMVEPWEKAVIHGLFLTVFILFWYFNTSIVLSGISRLRISTPAVEEMS